MNKTKKILKVIYNVLLYCFAVAGVAIIGAWAVYQLGWTKNRGAIDNNNRYLVEVAELKKGKINKEDAILSTEDLAKLTAISKLYPQNADLILKAIKNSEAKGNLQQMIAACEMYLQDNESYFTCIKNQNTALSSLKKDSVGENVIQWMNLPEWYALKEAIVKDKAEIDSAAKVAGVESRMIVSCLVGEQIRLFNSKREMYKKYLGPVKVLSVQSQFSFGVNGIKDFTAMQVEKHLKDDTSSFYMGKKYENILDFKTENHQEERMNRLVDYKSHYYSYLYTACILHQTKIQWQRAGYDIASRPEILFTLFNIG
ncbi:MAG: hypothetical protein J6V35_02675, partial [Bacteroidales bacterium]|nr:hypothetical protein [Bacteroidales bacterium]